MVFTPIHRALDLEPGDLTFELLDQAVAAGVREADDLDWKLTLPQDSGDPKWRDEFAKDVAAMANSGGGWLVYGVREDRKTSAATAVEGVSAVNQGVEQRLRGVAHGHIRPAVSELRFYAVSEPGRSDVLALHVPSSLDTPHLVSPDPQWFQAPRRFGAQTVWMAERDIEQAYRARFTSQHDRHAALDALLRAQLRQSTPLFESASVPHVVVVGAAVPLEPRRPREMSQGDAHAAFEEADALARSLAGEPPSRWHNLPPRRAMRRYTLDLEGSTSSLFLDGSVTVAGELWRPQGGLQTYGGPVLPDYELEAAVAKFVATIAAASRSMSITGPHITQVTVFWRPSGPLRFARQDPRQPESSRLVEPPVMLHEMEVVDAEVRGDGSLDELKRSARSIALDVLHQGGIERSRYLS